MQAYFHLCMHVGCTGSWDARGRREDHRVSTGGVFPGSCQVRHSQGHSIKALISSLWFLGPQLPINGALVEFKTPEQKIGVLEGSSPQKCIPFKEDLSHSIEESLQTKAGCKHGPRSHTWCP